jgi:Cu2+-exporting ATPase
VLDALDLGRATLDKIRANLTWALGYNIVGIPLAAGSEPFCLSRFKN